MAAGVSRKISPASARAHTRKSKSKNSFLPSGIITKILIVFFVGFLAWAYKATQPPPPKICGSPGGPPITASRIKLKDGRHLAYNEYGVSKDKAKHKVVYVHGTDFCRYDVPFLPTLSEDTIESLGVYIVAFDRPGYGESDPHPEQTQMSIAYDIEELADQLVLGSKFYITGYSAGGQVVWACLKYIPHRLAGAALISPAVNWWWPGFPANLSNQGYKEMIPQDQWAIRVFHYIPWLTYWWNTQNYFPTISVVTRNPAVFSRQDKELFTKITVHKDHKSTARVRQQGVFETIHRDLMVAYGKWEFDPMDLENPFPNNEGSVHLWMGNEDGFVPVSLQRYIAQRLPWICYHEVKGAGHFLPYADGIGESIINPLLSGAC